MKKKIYAFLGLTFALFADDVLLKDGTVFQNVNILKTEGELVYLQSTVREFTTPIDRIKAIEKRPFDPSTPSQTIVLPGQKPTTPRADVRYAYPNVKLWPVSVVSFAVAWEMFVDAGNVQDWIDAFKDAGVSGSALDELERTKTRKTVIAAASLLAGMVNTFFVFERVQVTTDNGMLGFAYHF